MSGGHTPITHTPSTNHAMKNDFFPTASLLLQELNNTAKADEVRGEPLHFGPNGRYQLLWWEETETWFVDDTEQVDEAGIFVIISEAPTAAEALDKAMRRL